MQWSAPELEKAARWKKRIAAQSSNAVDLIKEQVVKKLSSSEFEELVKDILDIEKFENTKLTRGAGEHGADIVMSVSAPLF